MRFSPTFIRFCIVGLLNTFVDVGCYTALHASGLSIFVANLISTSLGLAVSFVLHSRFTFRRQTSSRNQTIWFLTITITSLWLLQPLIILLITHLDKSAYFIQSLLVTSGHVDLFSNLFPKLGAIGFTLVWNYFWYKQKVFAIKPN